MNQKLRNTYKTANSMKWITQEGNFMTNSMVKIGFYLPVLSATKTVTWKYHVDDSTYYIFKNCIPKKTATNSIRDPLEFEKTYVQELMHI